MIPSELQDYWTKMAQKPTEHEACGWSERSQTVRFLRAIEAVDLADGDSVLDYGCGTGRLFDFLPEGLRYTGQDTNQAMVTRANLERPEGKFIYTATMPVGTFDHVFALGVWNVKPWDMGQTRKAIEMLWRATAKTLVVSLLRRSDDPLAVCYPPLQIASWAVLWSKKWLLDCAYLPHDILLVLEK